MRKSLSEILNQGGQEKLSQAWGETKAAEDFAPLPAGEYFAVVVSGAPFNSPVKGTPGYKITFRVSEGEHQGCQFWLDIWLTPAALPMAKRDLAKLGITALEQLEKPLPQGIRCKVKLVLHCDDDGTERNRVKTFSVIGIEPDVEPFAPSGYPPTSPKSPPEAGEVAL